MTVDKETISINTELGRYLLIFKAKYILVCLDLLTSGWWP